MNDLSTMLDEAEVELAKFPKADIPTEHAFAFGFYIRKVVMPAGSVVSTKTHGLKSPFCVTKGRCLVRSMDGNEEEIIAPHVGITEAGTRRIICVLEDTEWTTFQSADPETFSQIIDNFEAQIMIPHQGLVPYADSLNRQTNGTLHD